MKSFYLHIHCHICKRTTPCQIEHYFQTQGVVESMDVYACTVCQKEARIVISGDDVTTILK